MRVAIDIAPLSDQHRTRGIGSYTQSLIDALKRYDKQNEYIYFTRRQKLPKNVDLVHYPYFEPFSLTLPLRKLKPTVVTIHDLIPLVFPNKFPKGFRGEIKWQIQKFSLGGVSAVIADSENSKKDLIKYGGCPEDKIYVVYLAPAEIFKPLRASSSIIRIIEQKYNLPENFILYVGDVNWNKNIPGLIGAFSILAKSLSLQLVLVGEAFKNTILPQMREIFQLINQLKLKEKIRFLGFVPRDDLVGIYNLATVYVQPSFYEGFGLPVLEAMACGTPVVCAKTSSLLEITGGAAVFVNPENPEDIARGISEVLHYDTVQYHSRVEAGLKQAQKFSWKKTAEETWRVYQKIFQSARK